MGKLKNVTVTITREKRKKQQYSYTIDRVGGSPDLKAQERYSEARSARRSALGELDAEIHSGEKGRASRYSFDYDWYNIDRKGTRRLIVFVYKG